MRRERVIAAVAVTVAVSAVAAFAVYAAVASLQEDFAAYWVAGGARRLGLDPYVNHVGRAAAPGLWDGVAPFGHSRFLYPPLVAELFRPLAALPYRSAKALYTGAAVAAWLASALLLGRRAGPVFLGAGALYFPLYLHLERGQIDLFALPFLVIAWRHRARLPIAAASLAAAATLKPALLGALPVLAALGRWRWAATAGGALLVAAALTLTVSGPGLVAEYRQSVLPRALLYGEGGTEAMLLSAARLPKNRDDGLVVLDGHAYPESLWELPASASLPRLLAPRAPSRLTALAPYFVAAVGLSWAGRRVARRRRSSLAPPAPDDPPGALVAVSIAIACVVTSPAGWLMGLVWALPLAPLVAGLRAAGRVPPGAALALAAAWLGCALPPLVPGFGAVAGAALALAASYLAVALARATEVTS